LIFNNKHAITHLSNKLTQQVKKKRFILEQSDDEFYTSHSGKRGRLKTVIQELMYLAARLIASGRRLHLRFSRHCPAYQPPNGSANLSVTDSVI
jgi:hypothetical protein